ncbi:MAG: DUF4199 domain-containing protein [Bacteroidales bacterium]|nr:DUF4199 domain-containing protein [Bacteroidales bacterium]
MENRVSVWKANLNNGIILGLAGVVFTLALWFTDQTSNNKIGYLWFLVLAVALYFMIKSYRDNYLRGFITYGQSLGAGVVIMLYYAIISAIFGYILYKFLDPGLIDKMLIAAEEAMIERGIPESALEQGLNVQKKMMTPAFISVMSVFSTMLAGTILSLLISIFTRREGNPLIDDTIEDQIEG